MEAQERPGGGHGEELAAVAEELTDAVTALTDEVRRNRRFSARTAAGLALVGLLVIGLTLALASLAVSNGRLRDSLSQNYVTARQQSQTRIEVLCPLYSVLLASAHAQPPPGEPGSEQRRRYDASVQVISDGYATLGCPGKQPSAVPTG